MGLKEKSIISVLWVALGRVIRQSSSWVITVLIARMLAPSIFGEMALVNVILAFGQMLNDLGVGSVIVQKKDLDEKDLNVCFWLSMALGLVLCGMVFFGSTLAAQFFNNEHYVLIFKVMSVVFIIGAIRIIPTALLNRKLRFKHITFSNVAADLISGILSLYMVYIGFGIWGLVAGALIREFICTVMTVYYNPWFPQLKFSMERLKYVMGFGLSVTGSRILWYFNQQFDYMVIGKVLGEVVLGYYRLAYVIGRTPLKKIWMVVSQVTVPIFSKLQDDNERLKKYFLTSIKYLSIIVFPACVGLFLLADDFVILVLTEKWLPMILPLKVFLVLAILECITITVPPIMVSIKKPHVNFYMVLVTTLIIVPSMIYGVRYGVEGILVVWVCILPLSTIIRLGYIFRQLKMTTMEFMANISLPLLGSAFMGASVFSAQYFLGHRMEMLPRFILFCSIGVVAYLVFMLLFAKSLILEIKGLYKSVASRKKAIPEAK